MIIVKKILTLFIENGADVNQIIYHFNLKVRTTPLLRAIECNNERAIKFLLKSGADINLKGKPSHTDNIHSPLSYAIHLQYDDIIDILIGHGASL